MTLPATANRQDYPRLVKNEVDAIKRRLVEQEQLTRAKLWFLNG